MRSRLRIPLLVLACIACGALRQASMLISLSPPSSSEMEDVVIENDVDAPRGFFVKSPIAFTHIPKCSGTSFRVMMQPEFAEQDCYRHVRRVNGMNVVFLRSPRAHVQSQFLECTYDDWGRRVTNNTDFPRNNSKMDMENFATWLQHFVTLPDQAIGGQHDFYCFDPRNLQTRHMSCAVAPNPEANHALTPFPPDIQQALVSLRHASFVGLTDFFHESMCMIQLRRNRILPAHCICHHHHDHGDGSSGGQVNADDDDSLSSSSSSSAVAEQVHIRHGVPPHNSAQFPDHVADMIDSLTSLDRILFVAALERFLQDVDLAEKIANRRFLCNRTKATELMELYSSTSSSSTR